MNYKFTSDGRKVVVVGALNAKETIVQEVFVTDGTEFPAGEHFVVKTLLDRPAETYRAKKEREIEDHIKRLESDRNKLVSDIAGYRFKAQAATAKVKWIEGIKEAEVYEAFENIKAMLCGEYTHVVIPTYSELKIEEWNEKFFARSEDRRDTFDSLRLISLYGDWNGRLQMGWRINTYSDGSGSHTKFFPCRSLHEAVEKAKELIYAKDKLSTGDYQTCVKYSIPIDEVKNIARIQAMREGKEKEIASAKKTLEIREAELKEIG